MCSVPKHQLLAEPGEKTDEEKSEDELGVEYRAKLTHLHGSGYHHMDVALPHVPETKAEEEEKVESDGSGHPALVEGTGSIAKSGWRL